MATEGYSALPLQQNDTQYLHCNRRTLNIAMATIGHLISPWQQKDTYYLRGNRMILNIGIATEGNSISSWQQKDTQYLHDCRRTLRSTQTRYKKLKWTPIITLSAVAAQRLQGQLYNKETKLQWINSEDSNSRLFK